MNLVIHDQISVLWVRAQRGKSSLNVHVHPRQFPLTVCWHPFHLADDVGMRKTAVLRDAITELS
jgi:hypothetical protein